MILCLDVGNTQTYGGIYDKSSEKDLFHFRFTSTQKSTSDEIGLFLVSVLRENNIDANEIEHIAICSVVPQSIYSIKNACLKYFNKRPFLLEAGVKTGLKIKYKNPIEVGADRIANAIAAVEQYPDKNIIVADFGTATTFCAISSSKDYLGGIIMPGLRLSMEALEAKTAKLPSVEIMKPEELIGRTTVGSIQSGLYYSNLYATKGIIADIKRDYFGNKETIVVGTGGFSRLFESTGIFDQINSDLVLKGLLTALKLNI